MKAKKKQRKIEKKAVFLIEVSDKIILHKRPEKGLLSGLWELPNLDGELSAKELSEQMKKWEIGDYMIEPLGEGKHIFSCGMADEGISYSNERHFRETFRKGRMDCRIKRRFRRKICNSFSI